MATDSIPQPALKPKFTTQYPNLYRHSKEANGSTQCDRLLRSNDRPGVKIFFKKSGGSSEAELSIAIHRSLPECTPHIYRTVEQDGKAIGHIIRRIEGITLAEAVGTGVLPDGIEPQLNEAMDRLHSSGFVYMDFSVWNTLLEADGDGRPHIILIDFGLSEKSTEALYQRKDNEDLKEVLSLIKMCRKRRGDVDNLREAIYNGLSEAKEALPLPTRHDRQIDADDAFLNVRRELKRSKKARESFERLMRLSKGTLFDLLVILLWLDASKLQRGFSYNPRKISGDLIKDWDKKIRYGAQNYQN